MNLYKTLGALVVFSTFVCLALADGPGAASAPPPNTQDAGKDQPKQKDKKTPDDQSKKKLDDKDKKKSDLDLTKPPSINIFDQALLPRNETASAFTPQMMGDFAGGYTRQTITLFGTLTTTRSITTYSFQQGSDSDRPPIVATTRTVTTTTPYSTTRTILVPFAAAGAFKVAENASPRPMDRVFMTYNYYDDILGPGGAPIAGVNNTQSVTNVGPVGPAGIPSTATTSTNTAIAGLPRMSTDLNREVFGFEKTFLGGYASVEVRMPVYQQNSSVNGFGADDFGELTIIGKYAFILDPTTGNVLSGGLAVTAPSGPHISTIDGDLHSTLLQPWLGYIWNADKFFVQAFHSVVVPTDSRDATLLFNDIGVNYWLYRNNSNRVLNFIVPLAELHVTTPLDHRDANSAVYVPDIVVLTGGVHIGLFRNTTLSLGVATPVTGPRVYNVEGFVQLNWRF